MIYTAEQDDTLAQVEERTVANAKTLLVAGFPVTTVEGYLGRMVSRYPGLGLVRHECHGPHCENLTDAPVLDRNAPARARHTSTYCSTECLNNAAEAYWTGRAS